MDAQLVQAAQQRAAGLVLDLAEYLCILLRNQQVRPRPLPALPVRPESRYVRERVTLRLPSRERAATVAKLEEGETFSSHMERLVMAELLTPGQDLVIVAHETKPDWPRG